jgi:hypothetical protein
MFEGPQVVRPDSDTACPAATLQWHLDRDKCPADFADGDVDDVDRAVIADRLVPLDLLTDFKRHLNPSEKAA